MLTYPEFSPEIFRVGPLAIRWYGLMYVIGFVIGFQILKSNVRRGLVKLSFRDAENLVSYLVVGMLIGARLFYVVFYNWANYSTNPIEMLYIWQGGLSFHGAAVGMIIACALFAKSRRIPFYMLTDILAYAATPGLFCGRMGNFINAELLGRPTSPDFPFAMIFPNDPEKLPRHPSQIYQGLTEGILLYIVLTLMQNKMLKQKTYKTGVIGASFLIGYGLLRFLTEFAREPDKQLGFVLGSLSMGQILCIVMALAGVAVMAHVIKTEKTWQPKPPSEDFLNS